MGRWTPYNPNPSGKCVGDCTIRAVAKALGQDWEQAYVGLALEGFRRCDLISANHVWGAYLRDHGYTRDLLEEDCTVEEFAQAHPKGTFVLALSAHVVCVQDGDYYDSWDSGSEIPLYYWHEKEA